MRISKRRLKRIIKEEAAALGMDADMAPALPPAAPMMENQEGAEAELVMEVEVALDGLQSVMESLDSAAVICQDCLPEAAAQGPVLQAVAAQVSALQETLSSVGAQLSAAVPSAAPAAAAALPQETVAKIQAEARRQRRMRRRR